MQNRLGLRQGKVEVSTNHMQAVPQLSFRFWGADGPVLGGKLEYRSFASLRNRHWISKADVVQCHLARSLKKRSFVSAKEWAYAVRVTGTSHGETGMRLLTPLFDAPVSLIPFADGHVEALRSACAEDEEVWDIYPVSMFGEHFDGSLALLSMMPSRFRFAVLDHEMVVGMTSFINPDEQTGIVEIGGTYISPSVRGTSLNLKMKTLMIDHAFANGFHAVEFRVDTRNGRSMRAVEKLGARRVTTLEKHMTTWTGYVRDTAVFQLRPADWKNAAVS